LEEPSELAVDERNLAIVRRLPEALADRAWRLVRRVRIVVVHPGEPGKLSGTGRRRGGFQPAQDCIRGRVGEPLDIRCSAAVVALRQPIVVDVKPAIESKPPIQGETGDKCGRTISGLAKVFGRHPHLRGKHVAAVVAEAMAEWRLPGEDRRVRWSRERSVRDSCREPHAFRSQSIHSRRRCAVVPVNADAVRAQCVHRHEQNVGTRRSVRCRTITPARRGANECNE
jgi:hypothetical protein